ncbi:MAG: mechanosensitive ion channel family protein [Acidimicrobiia bacterium]
MKVELPISVVHPTAASEGTLDLLSTSDVTSGDIAIATLVLILSWPLGKLLGRLVGRMVKRLPSTPDFAARVAERVVRTFVALTALAIAMNLVGVNVGWFAVTVALVILMVVLVLRPLISNLAAGLLLETRPSFSVGDEIATNGHRGEVVGITARSTVLRTRDWTRVHIPNTEVLSDAIIVLTAFERRRSSIELEIEYPADIDLATNVLVQAAQRVDGVRSEPPPYVRAVGFGTGTYVLSLRWWHSPDLRSASTTLDGVVRSVKSSLDEAGITLPSPEVIVHHRGQIPG